MEALISIQQ